MQFNHKILNLAKNIDRWGNMLLQCEQFGIEPNRFNCYEGGERGYNRSIFEAITTASGNILILEDDCVFEPNARAIFDRAIKELPEDYDIMYLGGNIRRRCDPYTANLNRVYDVWTTHAVMFSQKCIEFIRWNYDPAKDIIFDEWLRLNVQPLNHCYIVKPMIAYQADGWSDIRQTQVTYALRESSKYLV